LLVEEYIMDIMVQKAQSLQEGKKNNSRIYRHKKYSEIRGCCLLMCKTVQPYRYILIFWNDLLPASSA
jgi:hypothetical protein